MNRFKVPLFSFHPNCYTLSMRKGSSRRNRNMIPARIMAGLLLILSAYLAIPLPRFAELPGTVVRDSRGRLLRAFLSPDSQWRFPADPEFQIPKPLLACVLMYEDQRFPWHSGVDPAAVLRAAWRNFRRLRITGGASTITMQTVRLAGRNRRTLANKIMETLQAVKLELVWSKSRIMHTYLDHAPYGGNIVGIQAAARRYFGKPPLHLTWSEAATLAVLPNSPGLISPVMNRNRLRNKRDSLLSRLEKAGIIPESTADLARREPLPDKLHGFQIAAAHWARHFHNDPATRGRNLRTSLDLEIQTTVEKRLADHAKATARFGIFHAAAVVLDTSSGEVKAYVGSPDYFNSSLHGQVDGAAASRSTGSILKPFLYALAMDAGLILPRSWIRDVPTFYGAFSPANADRGYRGLITAREALIQSLNIPAVRLLNLYGTDRFYRFLQTAGMSTLFRAPDDYGLTLILGGGEANLLELAAMYRGLGAGGEFRRPDIRPDRGPHLFQPRLISPQACWLTLEILRHLKRPGAEYYWRHFTSSRPVAWKTGTSYGQRDAWSLGLSPAWTIGIWAGNFNGEGNPHLSGAGTAAPLMFSLFNTLPIRGKPPWFSREGLPFETVVLCRESGFRAGPECRDRITVEAPPGARSLPLCPYHRSVFLTLDEKNQVCSRCWTPGQYTMTTRLVLPPEVAQFMRNRGIYYSPLPPHLPDCPATPADPSLRFVYPEPRARVMIPRDFKGVRQRITVTVAHRIPESRVFWYIDGEYRGTTRGTHKMALELAPGRHRIMVIDDEGNSLERSLTVVHAGAKASG